MITYHFLTPDSIVDEPHFATLTKQHIEEEQDYNFAAIVIDVHLENVGLSDEDVKLIQKCQGIAVLFTLPLHEIGSKNLATSFVDVKPEIKLLVEGFESVTERLVIFVGYVKDGQATWLEVPGDQDERWHAEGTEHDRKQVAERKRILGLTGR